MKQKQVSEMTEQERQDQYQAYIDYAIDIYSDMVPYDEPEYESKLMQIAMSYADMEMYGYPPEFEDICRQHDEMLERGELDDYYGIVRDENGNIIPGATKDKKEELPF